MKHEFEIALPKISQPAVRALNGAEIYYLNQISSYTKSELLSLHGLGKKGIQILEVEMKLHNIKFKDE